MDQPPPPRLMLTFRVAAALKLLGTLVAIGLGYLLIREWLWDRWWMSLVSAALLLLVLLPWPRWRGGGSLTLAHGQLIIALALGIAAPHVDLVQSAWRPYPPLTQNSLFARNIAWSQHDVNSIHALGLLFVMVPVVLASWQYGLWGVLGGMAGAGLFYVVTPLFLPAAAFAWGIYAIRGFVILGVSLILAFTVGALATAQRREQHALAQANRRLADQAATLEQLATSRERNRLARELHDTLAHALSGTAVQLQAIRTLLPVAPESAATELADAQTRVRQGLEEARRAIAALRAEPIVDLGLAEALRQRARQLAERLDIDVTCDIDALDLLPPFLEQTLYRVADEALLNAEKYAAAGSIRIIVRRRPGRLELTVADDGLGFAPEAAAGPGRYGLIGLRERAGLVGGDLTVDSAPGRGTLVRLTVPAP